jgi:hypothetical protein
MAPVQRFTELAEQHAVTYTQVSVVRVSTEVHDGGKDDDSCRIAVVGSLCWFKALNRTAPHPGPARRGAQPGRYRRGGAE